MKRVLLIAAVALGVGVMGGPAEATQKPKKVTLCHWANGHPHTITISKNAAKKHLVWHVQTGWQPAPGHEKDTIGACPNPTTTTTTSPSTTTTTTSQQSTTTTTSQGGTTSSTVTTTTIGSGSGSTSSTTPPSTTPSATGLTCVTPDGYPFVTSYETCPTTTSGSTLISLPVMTVSDAGEKVASPASVTELPLTGSGANTLVKIAVTLLALGALALLARWAMNPGD